MKKAVTVGALVAAASLVVVKHAKARKSGSKKPVSAALEVLALLLVRAVL